MFFVFVSADSVFYPAAMILFTLLTSAAVCCITDENGAVVKIAEILKPVSAASYEIYLAQYPVIYIYDRLFGEKYTRPVRMAAITAVTLIAAGIMHFCFAKMPEGKLRKTAKMIVRIPMAVLVICGAFVFAKTEDHSAEMAALDAQLQASEDAMKRQQENFAAQSAEWDAKMAELTAGQDMYSLTSSLPVVFVGDSVMLGASGTLMRFFPNCYVDAQKSRTAWVANAILVDLKEKGMLNGTVVIHLGTNGDCPDNMKREILETCAGCDIFWINVTNDADVHVNRDLEKVLSEYDNAYYVDWKAYSEGHSEYFVADGIHLNETGQQAYADFVYKTLYDFYSARYTRQRDAEIARLENERKNTVSFFGDSLLLNLYDSLYERRPDAYFYADSESESYDVIAALTEASENGILSGNIYVVTGRDVKITQQVIDSAAEICGDGKLIIAAENTENGIAAPENTEIISLDGLAGADCYLADGTHLNDEGCIIYADAIIRQKTE